MAEKSDIPRASASLRSTTPMVRITSGPGVDSARMRAWTSVMLVPPRKRRIAPRLYGSRRAHAVPRPEFNLTHEVRWDQEIHVSKHALVGCNDLQAPPQRLILMRLPVALCSQCHGAQPTALGCACEGGVRGDRVRGGYDPVQTA